MSVNIQICILFPSESNVSIVNFPGHMNNDIMTIGLRPSQKKKMVLRPLFFKSDEAGRFFFFFFIFNLTFGRKS